MNNVRKAVLPRDCIAVVAAYHRRNKRPKHVASTRNRRLEQFGGTCTQGNALGRARKVETSIGTVVSTDETVHGSKGSAYRSANIIQQPVHGLAANAYLERMLRYPKGLYPYV
jgi:hypothetical protein